VSWHPYLGDWKQKEQHQRLKGFHSSGRKREVVDPVQGMARARWKEVETSSGIEVVEHVSRPGKS
jgi:hypothetical protein